VEFTKTSGDNFTIIAKKVLAEAFVNSTQGSLTNVTIRLLSLTFSHFKGLWVGSKYVCLNRTVHIRHKYRKATILSYHRYLINTGVKNE
jgi:hypothetical protein